jgi:hypothetical protein
MRKFKIMTTHVVPFMTPSYLGVTGLATDDLRIAFLQATSPLCADVQRKIWQEVLTCTVPTTPPPAPRKCSKSKTCYR